MGDASDLDDLGRARSGDREALERLLGRSRGRLEALAERKLGNTLRARVRISDVVQSATYDILKALPRFDGRTEDEFVAWSATIVHNKIRRLGRFFGALKRRADGEPESDPAFGPDPAAGTPSSSLAWAEDLELAIRALEGLDDEHQKVILLFGVEGRSHRDVAEELGRSEGATRMLLSRARAALLLRMERLEREGGDGPTRED